MTLRDLIITQARFKLIELIAGRDIAVAQNIEFIGCIKPTDGIEKFHVAHVTAYPLATQEQFYS